jgi:hypothetical protein
VQIALALSDLRRTSLSWAVSRSAGKDVHAWLSGHSQAGLVARFERA